MKSSKHSHAFAAEHGLPSGDPKTFSPDQLAAFVMYKKERNQERLHQHYEKRKENGTAPRHKPASALTDEELERRRQGAVQSGGKTYALKQALRDVAIRHGLPAPSHMIDTNLSDLRELLRQKMSDAELKVIEDTAVMEYAKKPRKRKMADADGKRKPGPLPASRSSGDVDRDDARKNALSAEREMRSYARRRALYEQANHFAAMAPFADLTIEQIRIILRQSITDAEIAEIENQAVQTYDATHEPVERKGTTSRSAELLVQFFEKFPNVPRVLTVGQLSHENHSRYRAFLRSLDVERFRAREQAYDAAHREERAEAGRQRRQEDPEGIRKNEKRWRDSENGKLVTFMKDTRAWASSKGIAFELTKEEVAAMAEEPCFYCGDLNNDYRVDAVDVVTGFVQGNVKPCCQPCNRFKKDYGQKDFLRIMCNVGATHVSSLETHVQWTPVYEFVNPVKDVNSSPFVVYKENATRLGREFQMTKGEFEILANDSCHYCGISRPNATNGVDRVDSTKGYIPGNIVTCCGPCNLMKNNFAYTTFVDKAIKIMRLWAPRINACPGFFDESTESSARKAEEA
jgi:hypothetical protein